MKNCHTEHFVVDDIMLDFKEHLPFSEIVKIFQFTTFKHSNLLGLDHVSMLEKSNAFWVVSRIKIVLKKQAGLFDKLSATTWTHPIGMVKAVRDCVVKHKNSIVAKCTSEWCCLDSETRKIRKLNSIHYPELEMLKLDNLNTQFELFNVELSDNDYVYTKIVRASDLDVNMHTNNLKYNQMVYDAFSVDELKSFDVNEYEIQFFNETKLGDNISILKRKVGKRYYCLGKVGDKIIFKAILKTKLIKQ